MNLFEYVIVYMPKAEGLDPKILVKPTTILSESEQVVRMEAVFQIPEEYKDKLKDINIYIRPF